MNLHHCIIDLSTFYDVLDIKNIKLSIKEGDNKSKVISYKLDIPMSIIQRQIKKIMDNNLVFPIVFLTFYKFTYRIGLIHEYISNGNIEKMTIAKVIDNNNKDNDDFLLLFVIIKYNWVINSMFLSGDTNYP